MAGILDRYGIKEVADVTFYKLDSNGTPQYPVLYLDTLKVSTIEQTADESTANGGKGNPPLVIWDYNKDITVTLEDALFSAKSLAIMFGDGVPREVTEDTATHATYIMKTEVFTAKKTGDANADGSGWDTKYKGPDGKEYTKVNPKFFDEYGGAVGTGDDTDLVANQKYFCTFDIAITSGYAINISANSFPGTYYVTGDTYARSDITGDDEFFQFIIPKAKVQSENTITLEADGDPSTFNMSLHVMRPEDGVMMKLVKYKADQGTAVSKQSTVDVFHNHYLDDANDGYDVAADRESPAGASAHLEILRFEDTYASDATSSDVTNYILKFTAVDGTVTYYDDDDSGVTVTLDTEHKTLTFKHTASNTEAVVNVTISA